MTTEQEKIVLDELVKEIKVRTRYELFDNLVGDIVGKPKEDEIIASIFDGLDDINSSEPSTNYDLEYVVTSNDTRWKRLLIIAASKNFIQTIIFDWTANGLSPQIEDLSIESKLGDWKDLYNQLDDKFKDQLEKLKGAELRYTISANFGTTAKGRLISKSRRYGNIAGYESQSNVVAKRISKLRTIGWHK